MKVDRDALHLLDMIDACDAILEYTAEGHDAFVENRMIRDAVVRNLEVIGEAAKRLSAGLRDENPYLPWKKIAGLRDMVIHQYDYVDYEEIWRVVEDDVPLLMKEVRRLVGKKTG